MKVYDQPRGRLGNALFRYLASSLFEILYGAERIAVAPSRGSAIEVICDRVFLDWKQSVLSGSLPPIDPTKTYIFSGFFQHDDIYLKYKSQLLEHVIRHPDAKLVTDRGSITPIGQLFGPSTSRTFATLDVVIHLRLEDFIEIKHVIHPVAIQKAIQEIPSIASRSVCLVVNKPTIPLENAFLRYFQRLLPHMTIESNDVVTDFQIMRHAKLLICSCSTLSWIAAMMSTTVEAVYLPNYYLGRLLHETFRAPHPSTMFYVEITSNEAELAQFFKDSGLL